MGSRTTPAKSTAGETNSQAADQIVLMLISGLARETVRDVATRELKVKPRDADKLVDECERRIALAANYDRSAELGKAISRLNDCYGKSAAIQDMKTCVATQKELNKLLRLYDVPQDAAGGHPASDPDVDEARAHLAPLFDAGDSLPLPELARLAAARIVNPQ